MVTLPSVPRLLVALTGALAFFSLPAGAAVVSVGSHVASTEVDCQPGTERRTSNWVRSCVLMKRQTFNQVTVRNPGQAPTTRPMACGAGMRADFDEHGYIERCRRP